MLTSIARKTKETLNIAEKAILRQIMPNFHERWGKSAAIDLHECAHERLTNPKLLQKFVKALVKVVNMEAHGPCYVDRFGLGDLEGYSAMQFIKTSSITVHLDEIGNRAFIDIFSCKDFNAPAAKKFAKEFFQAKESTMTVLDR